MKYNLKIFFSYQGTLVNLKVSIIYKNNTNPLPLPSIFRVAVRIVRIFFVTLKLYGLYGFFFKLYGLFGFLSWKYTGFLNFHSFQQIFHENFKK